MPDPQETLTTEDLQQLDDLQMSQDPNERAQGAAIAKTLTPAEQQRFFSLQTAKRPKGRNDTTVLETPLGNVSAEMVALSGIPASKVISGAGTIAQKAVGAAQGIATSVSPIIKYEVAKEALQMIGLPTVVAIPTAMMISGYKGGGRAAIGKATSEAVPAEAAVTQAARSTAPAMATPAATIEAAAPAATAETFSLTPAETVQAEKWHAQGVPPKAIVQRVLAARRFTSQMGTPTPDEAAAKVQSALHTGKF